MVRNRYANEYKAYHITSAGIDPNPVISAIGFALPNSYEVGEIMFSNNGKKMAAGNISSLNNIELHDFDAGTGLLSNLITLNDLAYGLAFSPDDSKLYTVRGSYPQPYVIQFDLSTPAAAAINASMTIVATRSTANFPVGSPGLQNIKLGPDGRMYFGVGQRVHAINLPNLAGTACQPAYDVLMFAPGMGFYLGMPNPPAILPQASSYTVLCGNDSAVVLQAGTAGVNYLWDDSTTGPARPVTAPGYYRVTYQVGCSAYIDSFYVTAGPGLPVTTAGQSCPGQPGGMLTAAGQTGDTNTYSYTWMDAAGNTLRTVQSDTGDTLRGLPPGDYILRVTGATGCYTEVPLSIAAVPSPPATFTTDTNACVNQPLVFINTSGASVYSWTFGDNSGIITAYSPEHTYTAAGDYLVHLYVSGNGCADTGARTIHVYDPGLHLRASSMTVQKNEPVTLTTSAEGSYTVIAWEPAHLFPQQDAKSQTVTVDSNTVVRVIARSGMGCLDTAVLTISTNTDFFLPSSFTPNGDGLNDAFRPNIAGGLQPVSISMYIYDRWGKKVWQGDDLAAYAGWDGTYDGQPAQTGAYFYLLRARLADGKTVTQKGDLTLLR